ncbi:PadR family transcriptional regulator [candidate division KSB1 bacterium]
MKSLTVFEETVLLAIYRLKENAYSVTIHQKIFEMTGKDVIVGTLFNTLKQMDRKGYLDKKKGKPLHEKGSKNVMFYSISVEGFKALEQTRKMNEKIWEEIPKVLYTGR